jgi:hypothetical protein
MTVLGFYKILKKLLKYTINILEHISNFSDNCKLLFYCC